MTTSCIAVHLQALHQKLCREFIYFMSKINEWSLKWFMMGRSLRPLIFCKLPYGSIETDCMHHEDALRPAQGCVLTGVLIAFG